MKVITPTQFILNAAKITPEISLPMDKKVIYTFPKLQPVKDRYCFLCGNETGGMGTARKTTIKESFTDIQAARYITSASCCEACSFCLSHMSMRNYSVFATEKGLRHPTRIEIRDILLNPPLEPFLLCVADSGQKWLHYRSKVNYSNKEFKVRFEEMEVIVSPEGFREVITEIENLYGFFSKDEIKTGKYNQERIRKFGISEFSEAEERINKLKTRDYRLFLLSLFVAQKREEEKKPEAVTVVTQTTRPVKKNSIKKEVVKKEDVLQFSDRLF